MVLWGGMGKIMLFSLFNLACVAWRFCRAERRSGVAAKFAREARENERRSREKNKLLPPQSPRGFSALARLYYLVRPTKTAMLRRLYSTFLRAKNLLAVHMCHLHCSYLNNGHWMNDSPFTLIPHDINLRPQKDRLIASYQNTYPQTPFAPSKFC